MKFKLLFLTGVVVAVLVVSAGMMIKSREAAERATVTVNEVPLLVRVADNPWERRQGLSGFTAAEVDAQGMLFVFKDAAVREFWMKDMLLDLDVLWIRDGQIVGIDSGVKAPADGQEPARMSSQPVPADMVLELPAGYAQKFDLRAGSAIKIELP